MPVLKDRLTKLISINGPISVSEYMMLCLHDPKDGYYATRPGLGVDFITAPETSQLFGELLGVWLAYEWQQMGAPQDFHLVEAGPGRGTLLHDALRAGAQIPGFIEAKHLCLIEASPHLRALQDARLAQHAPQFVDSVEDLPTDAPILFVANEWLDCLPANQFVRIGESWFERIIGLDKEGQLQFGLSAQPLEGDFSHLGARQQSEVQPGLPNLIDALRHLFSQTPGRALLIDYGPDDATPHDSLRAYKSGAQIDPLAEPGHSDLTVDVDFARLKRLAGETGLRTDGPLTQSALLQALGIEARLNHLAKAAPDKAQALYAGAQKLVAPDAMGTRFKALCLSSPNLPAAAGF